MEIQHSKGAMYIPSDRYLLYSGVLIFGIAILLINLLQLPINWAVRNSFGDLPSLQFFALVILFGPLWEEFVFRYPISQKRRINKLFVFLYAALCYITSGSTLIALILALLAVLYAIIFNNKKVDSRLFLILFSALVWSILHFSLDDPNQLAQFINVISIFGLGLIFSFIRLRFSFVAVLAVHIIWNVFNVVSSYWNAPELIEINDSHVDIKLTKNKWFSRNDIGSSMLDYDSITKISNATLNQIVPLLLEQSPTLNYKIVPTFAKYSGYAKTEFYKPIEVAEFFSMRVDSATNIVDGFEINLRIMPVTSVLITDSIKYVPGQKLIKNSIENVLITIAHDFEVPIQIIGSPTIATRTVTVQYSLELKSFEEVMNQINSQLGDSFEMKRKKMELKTYYFN